MKRYDGAIFSKIYYFKNVTVVDGGGGNHYAPMLVHWGILNPNAFAGPGQMYIDDVAEFSQRLNHKRDWRIYGVKMIWHPLGDIQGGGTALQVIAGCVASAAGSPAFITADTVGSMQQTPDFKTFNTDRTLKRYYRVGKYFAGKDKKWLNIDDGDAYSEANTLWRIDVSDTFAQDVIIGRMECIWYIGTRGYKA